MEVILCFMLSTRVFLLHLKVSRNLRDFKILFLFYFQKYEKVEVIIKWNEVKYDNQTQMWRMTMNK